MATSTKRALVSVVIPCFNEEEAFPFLRQALLHLHDRLADRYDFEVVLVDDGSRDATWECIQTFADEYAWVRGITLSRNFGHQAALTCGYQFATGDAIVSLDADLQDPPEVIEQMLAEWEKGVDIVYAVRRQREGESRFKLVTAALFYRFMRLMGARYMRMDSGDFRLMSRRSLDALLQMPEKHRFIRGMVGWVGFRTSDVVYDRKARIAGVTKYPLRKMLKLAADAIVSFSTIPLRLPYYFAMFLTLGSGLYIAGLAVSHYFNGKEFVPGWPSLMVAVITFGCLNLIALGIMGEYIGRIYEQVKDRPVYLVREQVGIRESAERTESPPRSRVA